MTTYALVHGAWHGPACWDTTAASLRGRGHDAIAVDLPIDNPAAGFVDYAAAAGQLRRQHWAVAREPHPLLAYPAVAARAIVFTEDRVLNAESCAQHALERAAASVVRIAGGHCPMVAQPEVLAGLLDDSAAVA